MPAGFMVYIDESGDEGFKFPSGGGGGSSEWFILSAVVTRVSRDGDMMRMVADTRTKLNKKPKFALHFRDLKHEQRVPYCMAIAAAHLRVIAVLIHKPSLERGTFRESNRLYFYGTRYLLERVSWLCRDAHQALPEGDGSARIIFSNRSGTSYEELRGYVSRLLGNAEALQVRIVPSVVKPEQIESKPHFDFAGLQVADAVASGFYYAAQTYHLGFTEPRYVQLLRPVVYNYNGAHLGYGVKFWPRETDALIRSEDTLRWVSSLFG